MLEKILTVVITFVVTTFLNWVVKLYKELKESKKDKKDEFNTIKDALKYLIQSNLTNTYFAYSNIGKIDDYCYQNWTNLFRIYKSLGGNEYVDNIASKMQNWEITHTDILR